MRISTIVTDERRQAECVCCGAPFAQVQLSPRLYELSAQTAQRAGSRVSAMERDIPDGWIPIFCPACDRYDLARTAEIDQYEKDVGRVQGERQRDIPHRHERRHCCDDRRRVVAEDAA